MKAQLSSITKSLPGDQNSDLISQGWLYCVKRGQARTPKLPYFDWTGFVIKISQCYFVDYISCNFFILLLLPDFGLLISSCVV